MAAQRRPDAAQKYFMVSADGHANEPANLWVERIDAKYRERLPRVVTDKDGIQWRVSEGHRPTGCGSRPWRARTRHAARRAPIRSAGWPITIATASMSN